MARRYRLRRPPFAAVGLIALGLAALAACDTGTAGSPSLPAPPALVDTSSVSVGRSVRRLSHREYNSVVRDLLGDTSQPADHFGLEVYVNGFDNGSDGLTVQGTDVIAFQTAAEELAARAVSMNRAALLGGEPRCNPPQDASARSDPPVAGVSLS